VGKSLLVAVATVALVAVLQFGVRVLGPASVAFAFLVVWAPMTCLGTVSHVLPPRLPRRYHELRDVERDPSFYERLGVRRVKRLLRRGPLAVFNPGLHLPAERSREHLAQLEQRMNTAEASHFVLFVATLGVVVNAAARGWWIAAGMTMLFDVLINGYPVMLQRYNRVLLHARFPSMESRRSVSAGQQQHA
jgi:glycosyl-4,4'-diaponeurosporenoate acyltransferase